ncbi:MAG TPA: epoxide hydrolase N-terminal domain-containing protein, partial [Actinomycetota bacterium]
MIFDHEAPEKYTPHADPAVIDDLRERVRATRWPDAPEDAGWTLGTDLTYLRELAEYWVDGFDWRASEEQIARLPHFRVELGGIGIHVVHVRATDRIRPVVP